MSVLIRDMEMPESCYYCPFRQGSFGRVPQHRAMCMVTGEVMPVDGENIQHDQPCPLVPVPAHGRLIDADALAEHKFVCIPHVSVDGKEVGSAYRLGWNTAIEAIMENAETIIGGE